jgi:ribose 5-phosphate isomerase B
MIIVGSDHAGVALKSEIVAHLAGKGFEVLDAGPVVNVPCDYPDYAEKVCRAVLGERGSLGILVCGTGIGMSIAANKINGIRCALCGDVFSARQTRLHNDANVLAIGARVTGGGLALAIVDAFTGTGFSGERRHQARIDKMTALEKKG